MALHRRLERRLCADDGQLRIVLPQSGDGSGGHGIAGDDERLDAARSQHGRVFETEPHDLVHRFDAVGRVQRVAEVEIVLLRQQTHRLAQDADTAEAGIKKSDRKFDLLQMGSLLPAFRRKIVRRIYAKRLRPEPESLLRMAQRLASLYFAMPRPSSSMARAQSA